MKKSLPSVTFVTPTLNSESTIRECIESVNKLDYPKKLIKMFIMDDGSKDKTLSIVRNFPFCKVFNVKSSGPEEATAIGFNHATSDYVVNFSSDNIIPDKRWLNRMLVPLEVNKKLIASESINYRYVKSDKLLNRYFALFGMNDPIAFYLNKRDRRAFFENDWHLKTTSVNMGSYYEASFTENNMPTLGANGFVIRTKIIQKVTKDPKKFSHIDSCIDLLRLGYNNFAFIKTTLWHKTGENLSNYFYKRRRYALELYFKKQKSRRYHLYNPKTDKLKLLIYVVLSLTLIEPLYQSMRGYLKVRDNAWFLHPFICFLTTCNYIYIYSRFSFSRFTGLK